MLFVEIGPPNSLISHDDSAQGLGTKVYILDDLRKVTQ
jgi:hypothetical protein